MHFLLKEPFIAVGRGTSAHLLTREGFNFTTSPAFWQHRFNANILKVKAHRKSQAQKEKAKKYEIDEKLTDAVSDLGPGSDPWYIFPLMY